MQDHPHGHTQDHETISSAECLWVRAFEAMSMRDCHYCEKQV